MSNLTIQQAFAQAVQHHQGGRLDEAQELYRQILTQQPAHVDALHMFGLVAYQLGHHEIAVEYIERAIALRADLPGAHNNLGLALQAAGQIDQAVDAHRRAIDLDPRNAAAHNNLGLALQRKGQFQEAAAAFRQAIAERANYPEAYSNLGNALRDDGRLDEAEAAHRLAIALRPNDAVARNNLGMLLRSQGKLDHAIAEFLEATAADASFAQAYANLGNAFCAARRFDQAEAAFRRCLALENDNADVHYDLGNLLKDVGQLDQAIACYRQAVALQPQFPMAAGNLLYVLLFHPRWDAQAIAAEHRLWNERFAAPLHPPTVHYANERSPDRPLRVGYVSPDFCDHVIGRNLVPLLSNQRKDQFQIFAYANLRKGDWLTENIRGYVDHWRDIVDLDDEQVCAQIRQDGIDILVDLTLHLANGRPLVFARKPAPVQATFAGYPGSTGLSAIDYRLSDPWLDPPGMDESVYSEKTLRLPDSFWCYDPLTDRDISVAPPPALPAGFVTFGCLNSFFKINEDVLGLWAQVMSAVPGSRMRLIVPEGGSRQRVARFFDSHGINHRRIAFVDMAARRDYLHYYDRIDIGLDSFPYNGHTTSLDSMWMGVPVVTLVGRTVVGRAGLSQLTNLQMPELIANTPPEYIEITSALAGDLPRLNALRQSLRGRMEASPLMDGPRFARGIESALRQMWRSYCAGG